MNHDISQLIEAYVAADEPDAETLQEAATVHRFLPLYVGWVRLLGITPDEEIVEWDPEGARPGITPGTNPYFRRLALAQGAIRYAQLAHLLPPRPADAETCEHCGGNGAPADPRLICECGGLGWVVPGEDRAERW